MLIILSNSAETTWLYVFRGRTKGLSCYKDSEKKGIVMHERIKISQEHSFFNNKYRFFILFVVYLQKIFAFL